jgi:hypothetical protein
LCAAIQDNGSRLDLALDDFDGVATDPDIHDPHKMASAQRILYEAGAQVGAPNCWAHRTVQESASKLLIPTLFTQTAIADTGILQLTARYTH